MNLGAFIRKLKSVSEITFSLHFDEPRVRVRRIERSEVESMLRDPYRLQMVEDQGPGFSGWNYALMFERSGRYDLKIVVAISADGARANVITAHVQNKLKRKVYEHVKGREHRL
jgi:hypothetical protein